jgi:hypothetical protein
MPALHGLRMSDLEETRIQKNMKSSTQSNNEAPKKSGMLFSFSSLLKGTGTNDHGRAWTRLSPPPPLFPHFSLALGYCSVLFVPWSYSGGQELLLLIDGGLFVYFCVPEICGLSSVYSQWR